MSFIKKSLPNRSVLFLDLCCMIISLLITTWLRYGTVKLERIHTTYGRSYVIILLLYIAIYHLYDSYSRFYIRSFWKEFISVVKINCCFALSLTFVIFISQEGASYSRLFFLYFLTINIIITYFIRNCYKILFLTLYRRSASVYKIMIVTTSELVQDVLKRTYEMGWEYQISCITLLDKDMIGNSIDGIPIKADSSTLYEVAKQSALDGIFIHIPSDKYCSVKLNLEEAILEFENMGITVNLSIHTFGLKVYEKIVQDFCGFRVLTFSSRLFNQSQLRLKRAMDIIGGLIGCFFTLILYLILGPLIRITSPGPVFFSQVRIGMNGRRFKIYKFRTMSLDAEERKSEFMNDNEMNGFMFKLKDDPRVTKIGKFLRKTSLDEFPQFFNILKGDMSLVGTRPPTEDEFLQYEGRHKRRLALKTGLTGLWQISGRNEITNFEDVVKMDLEYIDNWSILLDIKILLKTVIIVLTRKGSM